MEGGFAEVVEVGGGLGEFEEENLEAYIICGVGIAWVGGELG